MGRGQKEHPFGPITSSLPVLEQKFVEYLGVKQSFSGEAKPVAACRSISFVCRAVRLARPYLDRSRYGGGGRISVLRAYLALANR